MNPQTVNDATGTSLADLECVPLLARLAIGADQVAIGEMPWYDPDSETAKIGLNVPTTVWVTRSEKTAAQIDPTSDEPTDR